MVYNILHRIPPDNFSSIVTLFYRNFKLYYSTLLWIIVGELPTDNRDGGMGKGGAGAGRIQVSSKIPQVKT